VSIRAGIVNLLQELKLSQGLSYLFVAHDLALVRHIADRVAVMYLGRIVETGTVEAVYENPAHPYTQCLLSAMPIADPELERNRAANPPKGCHFQTRCPKKNRLSAEQQRMCVEVSPDLKPAAPLQRMSEQGTPVYDNQSGSKATIDTTNAHTSACHYNHLD